MVSFSFKLISHAAVPRALEKAERYRLLNEPEQAESICRDILVVEPGHQGALVVLLLALADQLGTRHVRDVTGAEEMLEKLTDPYQRTYYAGIIRERWARSLIAKDDPGNQAYPWLIDAMACYESAQALAPVGNDDAVLRWNACARVIEREQLKEPAADHYGHGD
jgi:hypothetical protein